jgi:methylated-DNA-[protein]-cysteine S-methyltransferase
MTRFLRMQTPLGTMRLVSDGQALTGAYFSGQKYDVTPQPDWVEEDGLQVLADARTQLLEYFAGERIAFDLPLTPAGTAFQRRVWAALLEIRHGETCAYGDVAQALDERTAVRAVGAAVGRNPISVIIPCHRVLGSTGALTGYAGGLDRKRALLALEARSPLFHTSSLGLPMTASAS